MSSLSFLFVLLLVYTISADAVNEIQGTNEDENAIDINEEKRVHSRNPYSWMSQEKRARNPYSWMVSEGKRSRNPYSWMAMEKEKYYLNYRLLSGQTCASFFR
ncbi:hypothetical protein NECAME_06899 [Necator americanus]|uniref:Uncharacterized protein n=1 Tax=Necator americanus TaxID=51031 RepID=W2TTG3_NECAM|nr:hypothetical protein NECAME_06899 [Necator americanus]ETN84337.1 hypothetical protein NECAME_06899 [Necator americanus]